LDEVEFWKRQESEHTVVIRTLAPDLEQKFVHALTEWEVALSQMEALSLRYIETVGRAECRVPDDIQAHIRHLVHYALQQSEMFLHLLIQIKTESRAAKNPVFNTVLDHIRRESEYFIGVAQTIL
jgi:hypothetical protein